MNQIKLSLIKYECTRRYEQHEVIWKRKRINQIPTPLHSHDKVLTKKNQPNNNPFTLSRQSIYNFLEEI
jgi:hypothetical protein